MKPSRYACVVVVVAFVAFTCWIAITVLVGFPLERDPVFRITGMHRRQQLLVGVASAVGLISLAFLTRLRHLPPRDLSAGPMAGLLSLVTVDAFLLVAPSLHRDLGGGELWIVTGYVALVLAIEVAVLLTVRAFSTTVWTSILAALLATANVFSIYVGFLPEYLDLPHPAQLVVLSAVGLGLSALFVGMARQHGRLTPTAAVTVVSIMVGVALASASVKMATSHAHASKDPLDLAVRFHSRPDVHVISFESLQSPTLLAEHLDIHEIPFQGFLDDPRTRVFRNSFSPYPSTRPSLNSFLRLDRHPEKPENVYVSGRGRSEVIEMFQENGYWTQTGYANLYLGAGGEHVDDFHPDTGDLDSSVLCRFTRRSMLKLFGVCELASWYAGAFRTRVEWKDEYIALLSSLVERNEPLFTYHHMLEPGHTGHLIGRFSLSDATQRNAFRRAYWNRLGSVQEILSRTVEVLELRGRPYLLLVFGDHGPWLSRGMSADSRDWFVVRDRHGVINMVMLNGVRCANDDLTAYSGEYSTPARAMSGALRCLARDPTEIDRLVDFHEHHRFERYVYE